MRESAASSGNGSVGNGMVPKLPDEVAREEVDIWEALQAHSPATSQGTNQGTGGKSLEEQQLQMAIQMSLSEGSSGNNPPSTPSPGNVESRPLPAEPREDDLSLALRISLQEQNEARRQIEEEDDVLKRVLELSMQEK